MWQEANSMKFLIKQYSATSSQFLPIEMKYHSEADLFSSSAVLKASNVMGKRGHVPAIGRCGITSSGKLPTTIRDNNESTRLKATPITCRKNYSNVCQ
jgi:hypothetical protein